MGEDVTAKRSRADELSVFRMNIVDENYKALKKDLEKIYEVSDEQKVLDRMTEIEFNRFLYNYLSSAMAWKYKYAELIEDFDELEMTKADFYEKLDDEIGEYRFSYFRYLRNYLTHEGQSQSIISINSGEVELDVTMKREMILELKDEMNKFNRGGNKEENYYDKAHTFQTSNKRDNIPKELEKFHKGIKNIDKLLLNKILEEKG